MSGDRELDALIAEKVFGYTLDYEFADIHFDGRPCVKELRDQYDEWGILPLYSTDIGDAWQVIEQMKTRGYTWTLFVYGIGVQARVETGGSVAALVEYPTAPLAICRAALKAIGA